MGKTQNGTTTKSATVKKKPVSAKFVGGLLDGLGYRDLQKQCSQHGLDTGGNSKQLKERLLEYLVEETQSETQPTSETEAVTTSDSDTAAPAAAPAASTPGSKTGEAIAKEMLCPITHELPFDPVMAEDGKVYEHAAIQKHIDNNPNNLKSPITNEPMGPNLLPSTQVKNIIDHAIDNGDITGDLAVVWKAKRLQKQKVEQWKSEANCGNSKSAIEVAYCYEFGESGCVKKPEEAMKWWKIAADHGEVDGLAMYGMYLTCTEGVSSEEKSHALNMIAEAASNGSKYACLLLGQSYADGDDGVLKSDVHAVRWLRKGLSSFGSSAVLKIKPSESHKMKSQALLQRVLQRMTPPRTAVASLASLQVAPSLRDPQEESEEHETVPTGNVDQSEVESFRSFSASRRARSARAETAANGNAGRMEIGTDGRNNEDSPIRHSIPPSLRRIYESLSGATDQGSTYGASRSVRVRGGPRFLDASGTLRRRHGSSSLRRSATEPNSDNDEGMHEWGQVHQSSASARRRRHFGLDNETPTVGE